MSAPTKSDSTPVSIRVIHDTVGRGDGHAFLGIAPRGLMATLAGAPVDWSRWSPYLDAALGESHGEVARAIPSPLLKAALASDTLTWRQSAEAVEAFVRTRLLAGGIMDGAWPLEACNVREGHTASVWRVTGHGPDGPLVLAVNVARDRPSSAELAASGRQLSALARVAGASVAAPVASSFVPLAGTHHRPFVLAQLWVTHADELALLARRGGGRRLHAVTAWLTDPADPGRISGATGRELSDAEHEALAEQVTACLIAAATDGNRVELTRTDLGEGDWVWGAGGVTLVATSGHRSWVSRAALESVIADGLLPRPREDEKATRRLLAAGIARALRRLPGTPDGSTQD